MPGRAIRRRQWNTGLYKVGNFIVKLANPGNRIRRSNARKIFIDCQCASVPVMVVVDNDYSTRRDMRVQILQTDAGRIVQIAVKSQDCDLARRLVTRQRVLEPSLLERERGC